MGVDLNWVFAKLNIPDINFISTRFGHTWSSHLCAYISSHMAQDWQYKLNNIDVQLSTLLSQHQYMKPPLSLACQIVSNWFVSVDNPDRAICSLPCLTIDLTNQPKGIFSNEPQSVSPPNQND